MPRNRTALMLASMMLLAGGGALLARPGVKLSAEGRAVSLVAMVPRQFGDWREDARRVVRIVNPQTEALIDRLYSEVLARVYVDASGYRIMLSIAYGTDQRGSLQVHKPEVCYPAQGFEVKRNVVGTLDTLFGAIPVRRLSTVLGTRAEPVTYWLTVGDAAVEGKLQHRLATLRYGLTGRIPDGLLFRISSIDRNEARAFRVQERFVQELLGAVTAADRLRLSGLGRAGSAAVRR